MGQGKKKNTRQLDLEMGWKEAGIFHGNVLQLKT
jgi:hypothetical protein